MRIGIDCRLWNETGVGRYIRNLIINLHDIDSNNEYVLFVLSKDYENIKNLMPEVKWKVVKADVHWHTLQEQLQFSRILQKERLDLVHFTYFSFPVAYPGKFIITIHDLILNHYPTGKASTLPWFMYRLKYLSYNLLMRYGAWRAERIITVSNATKKEIIDHLRVSEEKIVVTHEGSFERSRAKLDTAEGQENMGYKLPATDFFFYVGNAYPHKNLERLIESFSLFKSAPDSRNAKLILVGKDDYFYRRLKKHIANKKLEQYIEITNNVSDNELRWLYKHAVALIIPSLMEGFGLPALEAMSEKCLVLASDIPSLKEVCGDCAIYFNPLSVTAITKTLSAVYKNRSNYLKNKKDGLVRAKDFSWHKMAIKTLEIYESSVGIRQSK